MNFSKKNTIIVALVAVVIGLLSILPQFFAISNMGDQWQGIYPDVNDDEMYYLARGQEVVDGHIFLANPYLYEHKDGSPMQFWLPDFLLAKTVDIFGMSVPFGYKIFDFILPVIIFILSYLIFKKITRSLSVSLAFTTVLSGGLFLSLFNRTPSPQFIFIFFLLGIYFFLSFLDSNKNKYILLTALSLVGMVYMYPYFWTMFIVVVILYGLIQWLVDSREDIRKVIHIILITLLLSIPYFLIQINSMSLVFYDESLIRLGMLNTHFPSGFKIVILGTLISGIFLYLFFNKKIKPEKLPLFLLSASIGSVTVMNHHIITGKNLEFSSHYELGAMYLFFFSLAYLWIHFYKSINSKLNKNLFRNISWVVMGIVLYLITIPVIQSQIHASPDEIARQRYAPVLEWINSNINNDDVVYTTDELSKIIPAYTQANVFYAREANLFFISDEEVKERFIIQHYFEDIDEDFIRSNERAIWGTQYINKWGHNQSKVRLASLFGKENMFVIERLPMSEINKIKEKSHMLQKQEFTDLIELYRVDYIILDKSYNNLYFADLKNIKKVFESAYFLIYEL